MNKRHRERQRNKASDNRECEPKARIHLRVLRDPTGGEHLALSAPLFDHDWQNRLAEGAANTAHALFSERATAKQAEELADSAMGATSKIVDSFVERADGAVACREGCDHCCHQAVGVTPPEALRIFAFMREARDESQLTALAAKLAERRKATATLTFEQRYSPDHPCPLLEDGRCSVYPVRPLSCRGMNSLDRGDCERRLRDPKARQRFLRDGSGQLLLEPVRAADAVSAGMQMALHEHFLVDMRPLDLIGALDLLFSRGASVAEAWLAGDEGFESALGGRAESRPKGGE